MPISSGTEEDEPDSARVEKPIKGSKEVGGEEKGNPAGISKAGSSVRPRMERERLLMTPGPKMSLSWISRRREAGWEDLRRLWMRRRPQSKC